jgi:DNA-binding NarL/FixJ family response regulator
LVTRDEQPIQNGVGTIRRALIVEDEQEFQISLSNTLEHIPGNWRVYNYSLGADALAFLNALNGKLDLALVDMGLPDMDGTRIISELRARFPEVPILVVTVITCPQKLSQALHAGATGYILKDDEIFEVAASIDQVLKGNAPISAVMARKLIEIIPQAPSTFPELNIALSTRETELLECIAKGLSYAEAAGVMGLKTTTIHSYSRKLFRKLGVRSQRQAIKIGQKHGLIAS